MLWKNRICWRSMLLSQQDQQNGTFLAVLSFVSIISIDFGLFLLVSRVPACQLCSSVVLRRAVVLHCQIHTPASNPDVWARGCTSLCCQKCLFIFCLHSHCFPRAAAGHMPRKSTSATMNCPPHFQDALIKH